jgi:hypothetical protein
MTNADAALIAFHDNAEIWKYIRQPLPRPGCL